MKSLKGLSLVIVCVGLLFSTGCASTYVVSSHNQKTQLQQEKRALQMALTPNGGFQIGFDFLAAKGYWAAWKADPSSMAGATIYDLGTSALTVWGILAATKNDDNGAPAQPGMPTIQNNGGTVIVNTGSGNTSYSVEQAK